MGSIRPKNNDDQAGKEIQNIGGGAGNSGSDRFWF
jgi:hypothetical protein